MDIQEQLGLLRTYLLDDGIMEEAEADELINTINRAGLSPDDMSALIQDISNEAGIPAISATQVKVEVWRKTIIKIMLLGMAAATIDMYIPGIYYTLYETLSITISSLLSAGYNNQQIRDLISNPIPSIPSIPNKLGMMTSLANVFNRGFLIAATITASCLSMVCDLMQTTTEALTIDNMKLTAKLAAQLAVPSGISYAFQVLRGDFDAKIAELIDKKTVQQILKRGSNKVKNVKDTIARAFAESAENVNNMKTGITWSDLVPNRRMDSTAIRSINNQIDKIINEIFSDPNPDILNHISKGRFLNDMLNIFQSRDKIQAVESFKDKYREYISPEIFRLLEILFAPPGELEPGRYAYSQPTESVSESVNVLSRSNSLPPGGLTPAWPESTITKYETKSNVNRFDILVERERLKQIGKLPAEIKLGTHKPITEQDNTPVNRFTYDVLIMPMDETRTGNIYAAIQQAFPTDPKIQDTIFNFIQRRQKLNYEDINYALDVDRVSEIIRDVIKSGRVDLLDKLAGGRRRYIKSRHYKKMRSTLRRRRVKGGRTQKGKKRRYTKRRR